MIPRHAFERPLRIRFSHCDPAGIVFFPQYMVMFNGLLEDWFTDGMGILSDLVNQGLVEANPRGEKSSVDPLRIELDRGHLRTIGRFRWSDAGWHDFSLKRCVRTPAACLTSAVE